MIICQCRRISDRDVGRAIEWMRSSDPLAIITPGRVFRVLGTHANCGGCMPLFLRAMRRNANLAVAAADRSAGTACGTGEQRRGSGT